MTYPPTQIHTLFSSLSHYKNNLKEKKKTEKNQNKEIKIDKINKQNNNNNKIQTEAKEKHIDTEEYICTYKNTIKIQNLIAIIYNQNLQCIKINILTKKYETKTNEPKTLLNVNELILC